MDARQRRGLVLTAIVLGGSFLFLQAVSNILLPFIVGLALAYLLNPVVVRLEQLGLPRPLASVLPVSFAVSLIVLALVLGVPLLLEQLTSFAQRLPVYLMTLQHFVLPDKLAKIMHVQLTVDALLKPLGAIGAQGAEWSAKALQSTMNGVAWLMNIVMLVLMTPVVAFYLLMDWPIMMEKTLKQLPRSWRAEALVIAGEIDLKLAAYLRGTLGVCLSMGIFYAVFLSLLGPMAMLFTGADIDSLELGWAIGLITGLMAFLPVIGATTGFLLMMVVALMQYQLQVWEPYVLIVAMFMLGQFLEGYVLNPMLVGNRVGLHPVWVMFALLAGGTLDGIRGMLLALPVAVMISVLLPRFMKAWRAAID